MCSITSISYRGRVCVGFLAPSHDGLSGCLSLGEVCFLFEMPPYHHALWASLQGVVNGHGGETARSANCRFLWLLIAGVWLVVGGELKLLQAYGVPCTCQRTNSGMA